MHLPELAGPGLASTQIEAGCEIESIFHLRSIAGIAVHGFLIKTPVRLLALLVRRNHHERTISLI